VLDDSDDVGGLYAFIESRGRSEKQTGSEVLSSKRIRRRNFFGGSDYNRQSAAEPGSVRNHKSSGFWVQCNFPIRIASSGQAGFKNERLPNASLKMRQHTLLDKEF
jgi:hypothetical protein